jgi:hypothetical protein
MYGPAVPDDATDALDVDVVVAAGAVVGVEVPVVGCVPVVGLVVEDAAAAAAFCARTWAWWCRADHDFDQRAVARESPPAVSRLEAGGEPARTATVRTRRATSPRRENWVRRPDRRCWGAA